MSDNYRAVYDAVKLCFSDMNAERVYAAIRDQFDISDIKARMLEAITITTNAITEAVDVTRRQQHRPSVLYRPTLSRNGDQWCALYGGATLATGVAGFGSTPEEAMVAFDFEFSAKVVKLQTQRSNCQETLNTNKLSTTDASVPADIERKVKAATVAMRIVQATDCDLMPLHEFRLQTAGNYITNDDGMGYWATATLRSDIEVDCSEISPPAWATHVAWYGK